VALGAAGASGYVADAKSGKARSHRNANDAYAEKLMLLFLSF
jgi:hypothetical protein